MLKERRFSAPELQHNSLQHSGTPQADLIAVQGIGGLREWPSWCERLPSAWPKWWMTCRSSET
jgi:hypothetical protein